jgi:hypothetical protein
LLLCILNYGKKIKRLTNGTRVQKSEKYIRLKVWAERNRFGRKRFFGVKGGFWRLWEDK